jgi:hypothetical protein
MERAEGELTCPLTRKSSHTRPGGSVAQSCCPDFVRAGGSCDMHTIRSRMVGALFGSVSRTSSVMLNILSVSDRMPSSSSSLSISGIGSGSVAAASFGAAAFGVSWPVTTSRMISFWYCHSIGRSSADVSNIFEQNSSLAEVESWTARRRKVEDVIRTTHSYRTDYDRSIDRVNAKTASDVSFIQGEFWNVFRMYKRAQNSVNTAAIRIAKRLRYGRLA